MSERVNLDPNKEHAGVATLEFGLWDYRHTVAVDVAFVPGRGYWLDAAIGKILSDLPLGSDGDEEFPHIVLTDENGDTLRVDCDENCSEEEWLLGLLIAAKMEPTP